MNFLLIILFSIDGFASFDPNHEISGSNYYKDYSDTSERYKCSILSKQIQKQEKTYSDIYTEEFERNQKYVNKYLYQGSVLKDVNNLSGFFRMIGNRLSPRHYTRLDINYIEALTMEKVASENYELLHALMGNYELFNQLNCQRFNNGCGPSEHYDNGSCVAL